MEKNQAKTTCLSRFTDSKQCRCGRSLQRLATFLVLFLCSMTMSWAQRTATGSNGKLILYDAKSPTITLNSGETSISQLSFTITDADNANQDGTHLETYYTYTTNGSDPVVSTKSTKLDGKSGVVTVNWTSGQTVKVRAFTMRIDDSDKTNYDGSKEATQEFHNTGDTDLPCVDDPVITPGDQAVVKGSLDVFNVTISHDQWTEATKGKLQIYYITDVSNEDGTITKGNPTKADKLPLKLTLTNSGSVQAYAKFTDTGKEWQSDVVSRTYILLDDATTYLNTENTKAVGTIVKENEKNGMMTMTYGGIADGTNNFTRFSNVDYSEDNILGSLHAVTNTTLYLNKDAMSEKSDIEDYYSHKKASRQKLHERTFGLPARGSFYKFEPEANGELTVFVEQQGAMPKSQGELYTSYVRKRPVYFLDEAGKSIQATYAYTSSKINKADWERIQNTSFDESSSDAEIIKKLNAYYKNIIEGNNRDFNNINSAVAKDDKRKALTLGTSIQPIIVLNEECNEGILEEDKNYDKTGYMTISEGYVTYRFPVKAGKTYYLFASGTKLALSGFTFKKDASYSAEDVTLDGSDNNTDKINGLTVDKQYNVTLKNRSFGANKWYALVLPFSVSQKQMKSVFGKEVKVLHYNNVTGSTLNLFEHYYQMIVGGTPVLVKPSQDVTDPKFNNVTLTSKEVVEMEYTGFKCTGSWDDVDFPKYSYFIDANKSKFYQYDPTKVAPGKAPHAGAFRTWIISTSNNPAAAKRLTMRINGIEDNNETTAIWNAVIGNDDNAEVASKGIYNLSGQKMNVTDTRSLSKGIYIVNGKKYIVK